MRINNKKPFELNCLENQGISHPVSLGFRKFEAIELPA